MVKGRVTMRQLVEVGGRVVVGVRIVLWEQAPQDAQWGRKYMRTMGKSGTHCLRRISEPRTASMTMLSRGDQQRSPRQSGWETEGAVDSLDGLLPLDRLLP